MNIDIITVNYQTPDLIDSLIKSIRTYVGDYKIIVQDGSEHESYKEQLRNVLNSYSNIEVEHYGYNIHHGLGLHKGILKSSKDFVLCVDSDVRFLKKGWLEIAYELIKGKYGAGQLVYVNEAGINVNKGIAYYHPSMLLLDRKKYIDGPKFIHHGAPAIEIMKHFRNEDAFANIKNEGFYDRGGRGTVNRFGYQI